MYIYTSPVSHRLFVYSQTYSNEAVYLLNPLLTPYFGLVLYLRVAYTSHLYSYLLRFHLTNITNCLYLISDII